MKILVVEDEKELANSIKEYLEHDNYICENSNNFSKALEKLGLYNYDCAIVDIMLPDGNGLYIVKTICELNNLEINYKYLNEKHFLTIINTVVINRCWNYSLIF